MHSYWKRPEGGGFRHPFAKRSANEFPWRYVFRPYSRTTPFVGRSPAATIRGPFARSRLAGPEAAAPRSPEPAVAAHRDPCRSVPAKVYRQGKCRLPSPLAPETKRSARVAHGGRPESALSGTDRPWDAGYHRTAPAPPRGCRFPGSRHRPQAPAIAESTTRPSAPAHEAGQSAGTSASCLHRNENPRRRFLQRGALLPKAQAWRFHCRPTTPG